MNTRGLIARKIGMTRMVDGEGQMVPVTLLQIEQQKVTKILTPERDGYHGLQIGFYIKPERHLAKSDVSRLRRAKVEENFTRFAEFRLDKPVDGIELGTQFTLDVLKDVVNVDIMGISKGQGFQGALTRWNAARGRMTHGSRFHRRPGSLGTRTTPGRVFPGKKMPGHHGHRRCTVQNLKVVEIDAAANVIAIKGSVPGHREGFLVIKPSVK